MYSELTYFWKSKIKLHLVSFPRNFEVSRRINPLSFIKNAGLESKTKMKPCRTFN